MGDFTAICKALATKAGYEAIDGCDWQEMSSPFLCYCNLRFRNAPSLQFYLCGSDDVPSTHIGDESVLIDKIRRAYGTLGAAIMIRLT